MKLVGGGVFIAGLWLFLIGLLGLPLDPGAVPDTWAPSAGFRLLAMLMGFPFMFSGVFITGYRTKVLVWEPEKNVSITKGFFFLHCTRTYESKNICGLILLHKPNQKTPMLQLQLLYDKPIDLVICADEKLNKSLVNTLVSSLKVPLFDSYYEPTMEELVRQKWFELLFVSIFFGIAIFGLCIYCTSIFTVPTVKSCLYAHRYQPELLKELPCVIESMRINQPETPDTTSGKGISMNEGTMVDVSYRYAFNGVIYVGNKYAPIGNNVDYDFKPFQPGHQTTCYINPRWPGQAVLTTKSNLHGVQFMIILNIACLFFLFVYCMIIKEKWKQYKAFAISPTMPTATKARRKSQR